MCARSASFSTVVLDGANVACQKDGTPSAAKLAAAVAYFARFSPPLTCVAFAPAFWLHSKRAEDVALLQGADRALLAALVAEDRVVLTPPQAHDDFYVIDYAVKHDGFVVTNDMFRDHVANKASGSSYVSGRKCETSE